ncbi:MAG: hypothetical protein AAGF11_42120 [Myxococcota bacterium]
MDDLACPRRDRRRVDRWRPGRRLWVAALAVGLGACSDDGLAPTQDGEAANGSTSGSPPMTGSVNTSATVTATASAGEDSGMADPSPGADTGGGSTGSESGAGDGTTGASDTGEYGSDDGPFGESTGGVDEPSCVMAQDCVCDPGDVVCEIVPPACPPGTVPEVDPGAMCWTFACVPADSCQSVPDCPSCGEDLACVVLFNLTGLSYVCEPIPPACMDVPSCDCMPDACVMPYACVGAPPKGGADLGCVCEGC